MVGEITNGSDSHHPPCPERRIEWLRTYRIFGDLTVSFFDLRKMAPALPRNSLYNDSFCIVGLNFLITEGFDVRRL